MDKLQLRNEAIAVIAELEKRWPLCFSIYEPRRRPLALGVHDRILEAGFPAEGLANALRRYVSSFAYLRSMTADAIRIDLDGSAAGVVGAEHAAQAVARLADQKLRLKRRESQPATPAPPPVPTGPKRLSLADLRAAAQARRAQAA
jgi:ProP effector